MSGPSSNSWLRLLPSDPVRRSPGLLPDDDDGEKVDRLELLRLIAAGDCGDERVRAWLQPAAVEYLESGTVSGALLWLGNLADAEPIDYQTRNACLVAAWDLVEGRSARQRASALAREVKRFLAVIWPAWRDSPCALERASELRKALFGAAVAGRGKLPTGWRQLWTICVQSRQSDCTKNEA